MTKKKNDENVKSFLSTLFGSSSSSNTKKLTTDLGALINTVKLLTEKVAEVANAVNSLIVVVNNHATAITSLSNLQLVMAKDLGYAPPDASSTDDVKSKKLN